MASDREAIIRVEDFTAAYDGVVVLDRLNFEVYAGEVFAILGGSGCGKSTLLKHILGSTNPPPAGFSSTAKISRRWRAKRGSAF